MGIALHHSRSLPCRFIEESPDQDKDDGNRPRRQQFRRLRNCCRRSQGYFGDGHLSGISFPRERCAFGQNTWADAGVSIIVRDASARGTTGGNLGCPKMAPFNGHTTPRLIPQPQSDPFTSLSSQINNTTLGRWWSAKPCFSCDPGNQTSCEPLESCASFRKPTMARRHEVLVCSCLSGPGLGNRSAGLGESLIEAPSPGHRLSPVDGTLGYHAKRPTGNSELCHGLPTPRSLAWLSWSTKDDHIIQHFSHHTETNSPLQPASGPPEWWLRPAQRNTYKLRVTRRPSSSQFPAAPGSPLA